MTKLFIAMVTFLNTTQIVYDLAYASGEMAVRVYSSDTYSTSALIFFVLSVWGLYELTNKDT